MDITAQDHQVVDDFLAALPHANEEVLLHQLRTELDSLLTLGAVDNELVLDAILIELGKRRIMKYSK